MKKIFAVLIIIVVAIMSGCNKIEQEKEEKTKAVYLGTDTKVLLKEIQEYTTDKHIKPSEEIPACYAESYDMSLKLDVDKKTLSGDIVINLINKTGDTLSKICVRNYPASILEKEQKGSSVINSAMITGSNEKLAIDVKKDHSVVYLDLSKHEIAPGKSASIKLHFTTDIPKINDRFGYHQEGKNNIFQLSFCFPIMAMYENGKWSESPYIWSAESNYNKVAKFNVKLEVAECYMVVASGDEKTEGSITTITGDNLREMAIVASNYMKVKTETTSNGIKINNYSLDYDIKEYNDFSMSSAKDSIELYSKLFGDYTYKELDVVQTFQESAMEYPGLIMIGYPDVKEVSDIPEHCCYSDLCMMVAHEVAHQWFYAAVGNDPYNEPWLDEGFAEYCEDIIYPYSVSDSYNKAIKSEQEHFGNDKYYGGATKQEFEKDMELYIEQVAGDKYIISKPYNQYEKDDYSSYVYQGGRMFLYELRKAMGDGAFFYTLREYYKNYCFKEAKGTDFIEAVKTIDDSEKTRKVIEKYIIS